MIVAEGERFNTYTHFFGAIAAFAGMVVLIVMASLQGDPWKIVSVSIYGTTLFLLYSASTLCHGTRGDIQKFFEKLDFLAIYLLIAGSYTPFTLVTLHGTWGWSIFGAIWTLAVIGIVQEFFLKENRTTSIVLYVLMGWIVLVAINPLLDSLSTTGFLWLLSGGVLYSVGVLFYIFDHKAHYFHGIWHLFVLAGSTAHYITIAFFVL